MTTNEEELLFSLAFSLVNGIGPVRFKKIVEQEQDFKQLFSMSKKQLKLLGFNEGMITSLKEDALLQKAQNEIEFCKKNKINIISVSEEAYPLQLKMCIDSPPFLFIKGNYEFNKTKMISIIGTRNNTDYGKKITEQLIEELQPYNVTIVSGLAYGIDVIAHKNAIKNNMPTLGIVAHSLDTLYPTEHISIAKEMQENGAIISEYFSGTKADKGNFPSRNRIVAGMSEATIIIETDSKGGSMITANLAYSYNKEVMCFPGKVTDSKSSGCNFLIKNMKASLITSAEDVAMQLGWNKKIKKQTPQRNLFVELNEKEKVVVEILQKHEQLHIDELMNHAQLTSTQMASILLPLEMQNIITVKPGKIISLS